MRSTELHGERRGWNLHLVDRVVRFRRIFLEVWIFRNVRDQFQNFVTHHFSAAAAKRKNGVAHQDHAGARLVLMADFVDPRLLDQLSRSQRAIGLVKGFDVVSFSAMIVLFLCSFLRPPQSAPCLRATQLHRRWDAFRVAASWCARHATEDVFAIFIFRQPQVLRRHTAALHDRKRCDAFAET